MIASLPLLSHRLERIELRPATMADAATVFAWRNLPSIVEAAAQKGTIAWETHRRWFADSLEGDRRVIFIIECEEMPAGQIRFDWMHAHEAQISLYLLPEFTGRGLGVQAIRRGCLRVSKPDGAVRVVAWVRADNAPSLSAFRKAGFTPSEAGEVRPGLVRWEFQQPAAVPHNRLTFGPEEEHAVVRVVRSGRWAGGTVLGELELRLARLAGVGHAVGVGSGVGALRLALLALGVGPGDAVVVPAYSCVALPNAVLACGAEPVPVDVDPDTWTISVEAVGAVLVRRSNLRAVIAVHTFGCVAPVREIEALGLPVIEDCSHAFGRAPFGALGRISILSLYATKLIGAGEGGVVLTSDETLAQRIRSARDYTDQPPAAGRLNDKMTDLEAALALVQLDRLPTMLARREALAGRYSECLAEAAAAGAGVLPTDSSGRVWYRYVVAVDNASALRERLATHGILAAQPVDNWCADATPPASASAHCRLLSLPLYPTLSGEEQDRVVEAFLATFTASVSA